MLFLKIYIVALVLFLSIDFVWLGYLAKDLYREQIGHLMAENVQWYAAVIFYVLYILGLKFFAIDPALNQDDWAVALINGAFFGFICYATYDLTNLATLKDWSVKMTVLDILWGTIATGSASIATFFVAKKFIL